MSQLTNDSEPTLLKLKNVSQTYIGSDNKIFTIFNNVNLEVKSGEIVSMIGRSGTGKSTLLRIIGGLDALSEGEIDSAIESDEKNFGISMIFQNAALFPWLTILENIEIGLKSLNLSEKERRSRALDAIHITGLNGFESAYPKEISEGMKQRVAIARALAVQPQILLMDDPFSNLDILTSNTLKADFLALRSSQSNRLKSVIMITNSIEDAVMISDRVLILKGAPSTIAHDLKINLPHPRSNTNHSFDTLVAEIYELMMNDDSSKIQTKTLDTKNDITKLINYTSSTKLVGFIKALIQYDDEGINIMQDLSERLNVDIASMREICELLEMFDFININNFEINLKASAMKFAYSGLTKRKKIFADCVLKHIPIAQYIVNHINSSKTHSITKEALEAALKESGCSNHLESNSIIKNATLFGRDGNLYMYNDKEKIFVMAD